MLYIKLLFLGLVISSSSNNPGAGIVGTWRTVDDETGEEKAYVEIYQMDGLYYGRIKEIFNEEVRKRLCTECPGDQKNEPLVGLLIMKNLERNHAHLYQDGKILWPEQGKWFDLQVKVVDDKIIKLKGGVKVFGGVVGRKQTWYRVE